MAVRTQLQPCELPFSLADVSEDTSESILLDTPTHSFSVFLPLRRLTSLGQHRRYIDGFNAFARFLSAQKFPSVSVLTAILSIWMPLHLILHCHIDYIFYLQAYMNDMNDDSMSDFTYLFYCRAVAAAPPPSFSHSHPATSLAFLRPSQAVAVSEEVMLEEDFDACLPRD